ncbi:hypothetical protein [Siphonobacter sp. BAB-5405]|uniref:hypothetical protein n=1 Tax=Siphonobacter sp. BAB-5405 TaxID=1864825 RepID=UPI001304C69C|nr:hypothetical protein [Siphonobacter sp. BAB-5405]
MVANNVLASAVCNSCNNGWMNTTDINVQNVLFEILNDSSKIKDLNEKEEFYLSRYIFKTALAASSMVANAEIPLHVRQMAMNHEYIPEGFLCLALLFDPPAEYIGFSIVKEWAKTPFTESSSETARIMDLTSFKFAIRFNSFIIGCAYIDTLMPCFYFDPDYYSFIYSKGSRYQFEKSKYHSVGNPDLYMTPENYFNLHIYASVYRNSLV